MNKWCAIYPHWKMHYNNSLAPEQIRIVDSLRAKAASRGLEVGTVIVKGMEQIMQFIEDEYSNKQLRQLAAYLGVPKELITFDQIRAIIDDLIAGITLDAEDITYKAEINIQEKIELNYVSANDRAEATEEYSELVLSGTLKKIWGIISVYDNEQINILKLRN